MTMIRKVVPAQVSALGEDEVEIVMSTASLARDGHVLVPQGCELENYRSNPIVLWQHDPEHPVGTAEEVVAAPDKITARVRFAPLGISHKADETRGLVKAGIVRGVSVGFDPLDGEPLDPKKPRGGQRFTRWELLECSFCSVPVDAEARVTARAETKSEWKVGASRSLAVEDSDSWDGPEAEKSIFDYAGGDDFEPAKARKGFLVYDAAKPKERGSYKLPIAHVVDGELKVPKGAIRAAASRLPQTDIPDEVKKRAQAVLDHYKEKAGMSDDKKDSDRSVIKAKHTRALAHAPAMPMFRRGLYDVSRLACALQEIGYFHDCTEYEAALEGDESPVPAMLGEALVQLGKTLIAMTEEEVSELLDDKDLEIEPEGEVIEVDVEERAFIATGKTPRARAWRRGIVMARAGRTLSASNQKKLETASGHHERAMKQHGALAEHQEAAGNHLAALASSQDKARAAYRAAGDAIAAAKKEPDKADDHLERAAKQHAALGNHLDAMDDTRAEMEDCRADMADAHGAIGRAVTSAQKMVRAVIDGAVPGSEDGDSKTVQKSGGTAEDEGSRSLDPDFKQRMAELERLRAVMH